MNLNVDIPLLLSLKININKDSISEKDYNNLLTDVLENLNYKYKFVQDEIDKHIEKFNKHCKKLNFKIELDDRSPNEYWI